MPPGFLGRPAETAEQLGTLSAGMRRRGSAMREFHLNFLLFFCCYPGRARKFNQRTYDVVYGSALG